MGYFSSMSEAQQWGERMRHTYPSAVASLAPAAVLRQLNSGVPTLAAAEQPVSKAALPPIPFDADSLTDTQVITVLETRRASSTQESADGSHGSDISLLRPDDTDTRRALKEAVVQRAPVSFAVQLQWSVQPIDVATVPALAIFRAYTLYKTEGDRDGRRWYCLRLGFFNDAISAKQVAHYVRSSFASVAVIPIAEDERALGAGNRIDASALLHTAPEPDSFRQRVNEALNTKRAEIPARSSMKTSSDERAIRTPRARGGETLEDTLELLSASEMWSDADSLSETGVRHLKVDFQKKRSKGS